MRAIGEACNPWDMIKAVGRSARWLFVGRKNRMNDSSYAVSRVNTDGLMRSDTNAYSNTKLNPLNDPAPYVGAGGPKPGSRGGKPPTYEVEEDRQPLVYDQANPFADQSGERDHSPYTLMGGDTRQGAGDIGVATSAYGGEDEWDRGRSSYPAPAIHIRAPSGQETASPPYPDDRVHEMPHYDPPPMAPERR